MRERHCRRPRLTPEALHRSGTLSRSGTPRWRTREEKRPHRLIMPRDAMPARLSSFRLLAMASPHWMLVGSSGYDSTLAESLEGIHEFIPLSLWYDAPLTSQYN